MAGLTAHPGRLRPPAIRDLRAQSAARARVRASAPAAAHRSAAPQYQGAVLPAIIAALFLSVILAAASLPAGSVVPGPGSFDPASDEPWPFARGGPPAAEKAGSPGVAAEPGAGAKPGAATKPGAVPKTRFVRVRKGETADAIATRAGVSLKTIGQLNPSRDLEALKPGQYLKLPR